MTVDEVQKALSLERLTPGEGDREVTGGYCGDLLSWVMGRAQEGDAWLTVMGNVNAVAVAVLADVACIILTEDSPLDPEARAKAEAPGGGGAAQRGERLPAGRRFGRAAGGIGLSRPVKGS